MCLLSCASQSSALFHKHKKPENLETIRIAEGAHISCSCYKMTLVCDRPKLVVNLTPCSLNTVMHQSVLSLTGWADVGFNNPNSVQFSPTLTRMAREGLLLTNHYVHFHCSPTRRSFLTGLFATYTIYIHRDNR